MRVLLLEDDPLQQELAATWLREAGHSVIAVGRSRDAMRVLEKERIDLAIFDWNLPDLAGDELLRWVRERQRRLPVMFATARDEEAEIASILSLGADDYVVKPLRRLEFTARVAALGRRAGVLEGTSGAVLEVGPYRLDSRARTIALEGRVVKMTPRTLDVAMLLFGKRGELVTRSQLHEQVWGHRGQEDTRSIDTHVSRLRQALELDGRHGWKLVAVYQHGYRLEQATPRRP
jgi:DNA-binding response OmpR family regulator